MMALVRKVIGRQEAGLAEMEVWLVVSDLWHGNAVPHSSAMAPGTDKELQCTKIYYAMALCIVETSELATKP